MDDWMHQPDNSLIVNKGIEQPPSTDPDSIKRFINKRPKPIQIDQYVEGILSGNATILSKAITLVESTLAKHQETASAIIEKCLPHAGRSIRIGITGVPGVGKSTFIESFGSYITSQGRKLAVLAIDPSSERTGGSILGDKTRMEKLSADPHAFIRPSPSSGTLGGVARKSRESLLLCEAAGFDTIFIETVGVGQSETAVHQMVDFFLLLMLAGAGDELQGIKRGIMEMADAIVITKADGTNKDKATQAMREYKSALHLFPPAASGWTPRVTTCSALENKGLEEIWKMICDYLALCEKNSYFSENRTLQTKHWMYETINEKLRDHFYSQAGMQADIKAAEQYVLLGQESPFHAAGRLLDIYLKNK